MDSTKNIVIVGGGPAGLMAAEVISTKGYGVTVYDVMPQVARKLLLAGAHGGLNMTHSEPLEAFITRYGEASAALEPSLRAFTPEMLCKWCRGLGQETFVGTSGRVFLKEMNAKGLLRAWLARLTEQGVRFSAQHVWQGWSESGELLFGDVNGDVVRVRADATLLALGGASWPRTGSDGSWFKLLAKEQIALSPMQPANCGFVVPWSAYISRRFAGQPLKPVVVGFKGQTLQGEITITEKGIEGSVIYALSGAIRQKIVQEGKATLTLDLRPSMSMDDLIQKLQMPRKAQSFSNYLRKAAGITPLSNALIREVIPPEQLPIHNVSALARLIKELPLIVTAPADIDRAISTAGGVSFGALDQHFMLKDKPGVFVAGEMMDWEAPTGGYLLQGCFSTAVIAAQGMLAHIEQ